MRVALWLGGLLPHVLGCSQWWPGEGRPCTGQRLSHVTTEQAGSSAAATWIWAAGVVSQVKQTRRHDGYVFQKEAGADGSDGAKRGTCQDVHGPGYAGLSIPAWLVLDLPGLLWEIMTITPVPLRDGFSQSSARSCVGVRDCL